MPQVSNDVTERLATSIKGFQPILVPANSHVISGLNTVLTALNILSKALGHDKYSDITSETSISKKRGDQARLKCMRQIHSRD